MIEFQNSLMIIRVLNSDLLRPAFHFLKIKNPSPPRGGAGVGSLAKSRARVANARQLILFRYFVFRYLFLEPQLQTEEELSSGCRLVAVVFGTVVGFGKSEVVLVKQVLSEEAEFAFYGSEVELVTQICTDCGESGYPGIPNEFIGSNNISVMFVNGIVDLDVPFGFILNI